MAKSRGPTASVRIAMARHFKGHMKARAEDKKKNPSTLATLADAPDAYEQAGELDETLEELDLVEIMERLGHKN